MAILTSNARNHMQASTFGLPSQRKYPMPDAEHAGVAKAYALQELHKGRLSQAEYYQIVAHANRVEGNHRGRVAAALAKK